MFGVVDLCDGTYKGQYTQSSIAKYAVERRVVIRDELFQSCPKIMEIKSHVWRIIAWNAYPSLCIRRMSAESSCTIVG